jgi:hypothetical protein
MTQVAPPNYYPVLDEKIPPEVQVHLRLLYDRIQNHFTAIGNQQTQFDNLQKQVTALQQLFNL